MSFFKKENLHNFYWTIIIAFVGFMSGQIWNYFGGPEKVIVSNMPIEIKDTSVTIVKIDGDTSLIKFLKENNKLHLSTIRDLNASSDNLLNPLSRPMKLPKIVSGYTSQSLNDYAIVNIPRVTYSQNEILKINLRFLTNNILEKISPIFMTILRKKSENEYDLIWEQQFKATAVNNVAQLSSNFDKGTYQLTIGFYIMDEINQKFPPYYKRTYTITII